MKFDNAFLTKNGDVGMQFVNKKRDVLSIYPDANGNVHISEHFSHQEKQSALTYYVANKEKHHGV